MQHAAAPMWSTWITERSTDLAWIDAARGSFRDSSVPAFQIMDFWRSERIAPLAAALDSLTWERLLVLRDGPEAVRAVDEDTFQAAPQAERFSRHDRAVALDRALNDPDQLAARDCAALRLFVAFAVVTPALATWLSELMGCGQLKARSLEFSRYREGDFIAEHTDAVGNRVCNLVSYLEPDCGEDQGGMLVVTGKTGELGVFRPRYNSVVVLPIDPANHHRVDPWHGPTGRRTVSISFCAEG